MREEEKLARDVYVFLYDTWGSGIFSNISNAEQRHMDALKNMLDKYGVPDPAAGNAPGEFTNAELQTLYDALVEDGSTSLVAALNVGVIIEDKDIADLTSAIKSTRKRDLKNVYGNLRDASYNHLNAFESRLATYGS